MRIVIIKARQGSICRVIIINLFHKKPLLSLSPKLSSEAKKLKILGNAGPMAHQVRLLFAVFYKNGFYNLAMRKTSTEQTGR